MIGTFKKLDAGGELLQVNIGRLIAVPAKNHEVRRRTDWYRLGLNFHRAIPLRKIPVTGTHIPAYDGGSLMIGFEGLVPCPLIENDPCIEER